MAQLFGKGTIKDHIIALDGFSQEKIEIIKKLYQDFQAGNLNDESRYEQTFNQLFFGELLGYEDRINRIPKGGVVGSGIADLTLGIFQDGSYTPENVQVVCELKGAKTNLSKKQFGHGGLSPVGQGFAYKTGLKNCKWLVVSNFYEIRLYRDNQTDFEIWTLDDLMDAKDDYFNLRKLYLLLHKNNLLSSVGTSKTEALLSHFREEQQTITKEFYKKYKELRLDLINDLKQRNQSVSIELLIEKAQKIIDRLIFVFFCEDKGLLPDKKLKENIMRSQEAGFTPWEITKKFFHLVDKGSESLGVPHGYNGGLFKEDLELNALEVGDAICKKFIDLTNYDFDDELSVNVLGHIFEQSISDLENLKITLLGQEVETEQLADTGKGRRKKDGIFYTPEYIVDYIVQNSVMKYLNEKEDECIQKYQIKKDKRQAELLAYQEYQNILQNIKVLDPACGSGAFLVRVFDVLLEENKRVGKILNSLFDDEFLYKNILTNNIYGVDLNAESVEITKLSLRLKSAQKDKKLNNLDANIKCGNSLIDDPAVAGEKAFDWNIEFREIMKNGGFDIIVGNPPYVRTQNLDKQSKIFFDEKYETAYKSYDIYVLFVERAYSILKNTGKCGYIMPKKFITADYGLKLRKMIFEENFLSTFVDFGVSQIFEDATTYTGIFLFDKTNKKLFGYKLILSNITSLFISEFEKVDYKNLSGENWILVNENQKKLFDKLNKNNILSKFTEKVFQGLATSADPVYILNITDKGLFSKATNKFYNFPSSNLIKPLLRGSEIKRYSPLLASSVLIFPYEVIDGVVTLATTNSLESKNPEIWRYLKECEYILRGREKGKMDHEQRYAYVYPKSLELFDKTKIMTQVLAKTSSLTFDNSKNYFVGGGTAGGYGILLKEDSGLDFKFLLALLNSKLLEWFIHKYASPFSGGYYAYSRATMEKLPIKEIPMKDQQPFIEKVDKALSLNKDFHEFIDKFFHRIQDNLRLEKITKKLEVFYQGEFKDFLDELKKQKTSLSLSDQDIREPYFKEYKEKILLLKNGIDQTDGEIDEMVFDLYGLSEEERRVVLDG